MPPLWSLSVIRLPCCALSEAWRWVHLFSFYLDRGKTVHVYVICLDFVVTMNRLGDDESSCAMSH